MQSSRGHHDRDDAISAAAVSTRSPSGLSLSGDTGNSHVGEGEGCDARVADRNESSKARSVGSAADETDGLDGGGKEECMALVVRPGIGRCGDWGKGSASLQILGAESESTTEAYDIMIDIEIVKHET